jgi:hypothetical protein
MKITPMKRNYFFIFVSFEGKVLPLWQANTLSNPQKRAKRRIEIYEDVTHHGRQNH